MVTCVSIINLLLWISTIFAGACCEFITGRLNEPNITFYKSVIATTEEINAVTLQFQIYFQIPGDSHCPILYLRHDGQDKSYDVDQECFDKTKATNNFQSDKQLFWFSDCSTFDGVKSFCERNGTSNYASCKGQLDILLGYKSVWFISIGYICGEEKEVNLEYNISLEAKTEFKCVAFGRSPLYLENYICGSRYPYYTTTNLIGYTKSELDELIRHSYKVLSYRLHCYKFNTELGCRTFFPPCNITDSKPLYPMPCRQMCFEHRQACLAESRNLSISCTAYANTLDSDICIYNKTTCPSLYPPSNGKFVITSGENQTELELDRDEYDLHTEVKLYCDEDYISAGSDNATCYFDGNWSPEVPYCIFNSSKPSYTSTILMIIFVAVLTISLTTNFVSFLNCFLFTRSRLYRKVYFKLRNIRFKNTYEEKKTCDAFVIYNPKTKSDCEKTLGLLRNDSLNIKCEDDIVSGSYIHLLDKAICKSQSVIFLLTPDLLTHDYMPVILKLMLHEKIETTMEFEVFAIGDMKSILINTDKERELYLALKTLTGKQIFKNTEKSIKELRKKLCEYQGRNATKRNTYP